MRLLTIALLFFSYSGAFAQYESLLRKDDWVLSSLTLRLHGDILSRDSAAAFATIDSIARTARGGGDDALELEARYMLVDYYLRGRQKDVPRGLAGIEPLLQRARKLGLKHAEARMGYNLATLICYTDSDAPKCLRSYLYCLDIANQLPDYQFPEKLSLLHNIAGLYYRFGEYGKARHYARQALQKEHYAVPEYLYYLHAAINTVGLSYRSEGKLDSALYYFNYALQSLNTTPDSVWRGETWKAITKGNIGITYMMQGNYRMAKPLLEEDVRYCIAGLEYDNALNSLLKLNEISLLEGDTAQAFRRLNEARRLCNMARDTFTPLQDIYRQLYYTALWQGDKTRALRYADSLMVIGDSLVKKEKSVMVVREALYDQELAHQQERKNVAARYSREVLLRNLAILLLAAGGGTVVYLLNRRRLHHKTQKRILSQRNELKDKALQTAREELEAFTRTISEKNALIETMTAALNHEEGEASDALPISAPEGSADLLLQLQQSILLTDEQWEDFQQLFGQAHPGYQDRLQNQYPNLTPAETRYILLLKLRLSQKEMASMLGISPSSIRIYRHRLRKKLQLPEDANLEELAERI